MALLCHCGHDPRAHKVTASRFVCANLRAREETTKAKMPGFREWGINRAIRALRQCWQDERGQDIAEYAVMLAVILIIVIGTVKLIGTNANSTFSNVASSVQ